MTKVPILVVFAGLPGVGKTTLSLAVARELEAVHLRIDTIEHALRSALRDRSVDDLGYRAAFALAGDNLKLGRVVVADSVNPLAVTREAWHAVAEQTGATILDIEVVCSDRAQHRLRVETRSADIPGFKLPTWVEVAERDYDPWTRERLIVDTARQTLEQSLNVIRSALAPLLSHRA